jgi:large subunit ribosomal protein L29
MKSKDLKKNKSEELVKELEELSKELFNLRMQKGVGQIAKPHAFRIARRKIARIKTILNERQKMV